MKKIELQSGKWKQIKGGGWEGDQYNRHVLVESTETGVFTTIKHQGQILFAELPKQVLFELLAAQGYKVIKND